MVVRCSSGSGWTQVVGRRVVGRSSCGNGRRRKVGGDLLPRGIIIPNDCCNSFSIRTAMFLCRFLETRIPRNQSQFSGSSNAENVLPRTFFPTSTNTRSTTMTACSFFDPPQRRWNSSNSGGSSWGSPSFWSELRQKAAAVITSSLSESERQQLMAKYTPSTPAKTTDTDATTTIDTNDQDKDNKNTAEEPEEKVKKMIQSDKDKEEVQQPHGHVDLPKTIAEAVAEARAQEAQQQESKFTQQMEEYQSKMEQAVQDRIELERRKLQFEQWKLDLEKAKEKKEKGQPQPQPPQQQSEQVSSSEPSPTKESVTTSAAAAEKDLNNQAVVAAAAQQEDPILGPVLAELGPKRLHLVSVDILVNLPVWKKQRTYRHDRAKLMAKEKLKSLKLGFPGVICLFEDQNGDLSILDGQHRVGMMKLLMETNVKKKKPTDDGSDDDMTATLLDDGLSKILVEVFSVPNNKKDSSSRSYDATELDDQDDGEAEKMARDLFVEINKAEPLKLIDMPGVAKESERRILTQGVEQVQKLYPEMFSASQNCRVPHVNIDNLRDALFAANVIKKYSNTITTPKKMQEWLLSQNEKLAEKYNNSNTTSSTKTKKKTAEYNDNDVTKGISPKALEKAHKYGFYLGLESNWMYD